MKIIKRNGEEVDFDASKIASAISKANDTLKESDKLDDKVIRKISLSIYNKCYNGNVTKTVEDVQNMVEYELIKLRATELAKRYITYRYEHELLRKSNSTDKTILSLLNESNEDIKQENSNKNPTIISVQRDYMAGEVSKDISRRFLVPKDIMQAHDEGIIHFHDLDYFAERLHNCDLINLEDMLQNGTVISGTKIDKPKSFSTACNIATQIIAQVASSQYGGQSVTLSHLAPFVDVSRQKIRDKLKEKFNILGIEVDNDKFNELVELEVKEEIKKGVQTIQYQVITLMTTNGQAPFITVFMYLNEVKDEQTKRDLALIIEETLKQRIQGVKNEKGVYITPAFPKLIYALEEDNITEDSKYWYLTELAAKCTAKRMVPDYVSEKIMKQLKEGNCFPPMGCTDGKEIVTYKFNDKLYVEAFERMWDKMSLNFEVKIQNDFGENLYIDLKGVLIYDTVKGFVECKRIIRNISEKWCDVKLTNGRKLRCTLDHPLPTNRGRIYAEYLQKDDVVKINGNQYSEEVETVDVKRAWTLGLILCDGCYASKINVSIALNSENDIEEAYKNNMKNIFNIDIKTIERHRGVKGEYKDLVSVGSVKEFKDELMRLFGGEQKICRQIPNEVFSWNKKAKLSFLAGMIDADGYMNKKSQIIQIGSTNKELALQQMALAQSLGMQANVYDNHYTKKDLSKIRYRVEFIPTEELISSLVCQKKKDMFDKKCSFSRKNDESKVVSVTKFVNKDFSYDVTTESDHFEVSGIYSHNCRSLLSPYKDENGKYKFYGRFNKGVVTINLVDVACSSNKDMGLFWKIFDERLELCHRALLVRYEHLKGTKSDVAPILWQNGTLARLEKGETIDKLLVGGYSSISLGYAGVCECVKYMLGVSHTEDKGTEFALKILQYMNDKCDKWNEELNLGFGIYGTPIESTTYKFAKCLKNRFGIIEGVTDKNYITNSYHVHVTEPMDAFTKLTLESKFQSLSKGGAISYVEVPNMENNIPAVLSVIKHIYNTIMYAEINTKSDYCQVCGYNGEIQIIEDEHKKLIWQCPNCKNTDQNKMNVARRTCGYVGTNFWNQGRTQEIKERVTHL